MVKQQGELQVINWIFIQFQFATILFYYFIDNIKANNIRANAQVAFEQVESNPATTSGELLSAGETVMAEMKRADAVQGDF